MNYQEKITELLDIYLEESNKQKEEYDNNIVTKALYEKLFTYLNKDYQFISDNQIVIYLLFNKIYKNSIYSSELYNILTNEENKDAKDKRFKKLIDILSADQLEVEKQISNLAKKINRRLHHVSSAKRVKRRFKHNLPLTGRYDIQNIHNILSYFETLGLISNKEELLLINEIDRYNRRVLLQEEQNEQEQKYSDDVYNEIPDILNAGFQPHDTIEVSNDRKNTLDEFAKVLYGVLEDETVENIIPNIEAYKRYKISHQEYNYIIVKLLNNFLEELLTLYELLLDKEIYSRKKDRREIIKLYHKNLSTYLSILKYYNEITEEINSNIYEETQEIIDIGIPKKLIYAHADTNIDKARIISDMDDIPHEYYSTVIDLLARFKNNTTVQKEVRKLTNNKRLKDCFELKGDQVRIVLKHVEDNIYCVMGVFAKKSNNDITAYDSMRSRSTPNTSTKENLEMYLSLGDKVEEDLASLVETKGRKGTR